MDKIKEKDFLLLETNQLNRLPQLICSVEKCQNVANYKLSCRAMIRNKDLSFKKLIGYACEFHYTKLKKEKNNGKENYI